MENYIPTGLFGQYIKRCATTERTRAYRFFFLSGEDLQHHIVTSATLLEYKHPTLLHVELSTGETMNERENKT